MKFEKMKKEFHKQLQAADAVADKANTARQLLISAIERVNDSFVALDNNWCYTYVNGRAARLLQRENPEDLIGKHIWTEYPEGVGQPFHKAYLRAKETQQVVILEEYFQPWDKWFENRIYPSADGLSIFFTDITERKKSQESLNRVNRALRVLSRFNEALIRITNENELLENICSVITEEGDYPLVWIGFAGKDESKPIRSVIQKGFKTDYFEKLSGIWDDSEQNNNSTGEAIRTGQPVIIKQIDNNTNAQWLKDIANDYDVVTSIALPIRTSEMTIGVLNIYSRVADAFNEEEVSLLIELVNNLAFGIATLRSKLEQRNLQIQLQQAQKMEVIGQLTGGIAHDFNNILGCIMGYSTLALEHYKSKPEPKLEGYLNEVYQAGERARDLVAQMLIFSSNSSTSSKSISLEPVVNEVVHLLKSMLPSSIDLHAQIDSDISNVLMDPVQLHQLVMNLCINARDALDGVGKIKVHVGKLNNFNATCGSCHKEFHGDFVELVVSDTGSGLAEDTLDKIFEPFFTTKEIGKGTGMGLSVVQRIVHDSGGHIIVNSVINKGSAFHLLFPAIKRESDFADKEDNIFSKEKYQVNGEHILVVDDEEVIAMFLAELLKLSGYRVTMVTTSTEALALFEQSPKNFDLIVTDQTMPAITGRELAEKMLQIRSDIPILLCTGHNIEVDESSSVTHGIKRFLQKPLNSDELLESVGELLIENKIP